jgi:hypothetical protein
MNNSNLDRILGVVLATAAVALGIFGVIKGFAGSIPATLIFLWIEWMCVKNLPVGSRGQYTFFGERTQYIVGEGRHLVAWPFGILIADCRKKPVKLDPLRGIFTKDNAEVEARDMSIVIQIVDLDLYNSVDPANLKSLYDDIVDKNVKARIAKMGVKVAVKASLGTNNVKTKFDLGSYGLQILQIIVPTIVPMDPDVLKDIQAETDEELQHKSQTVEALHTVSLINLFQKKVEDGGAGLEPEAATTLAKQITGKAAPETMTRFGVSADVIAAALKLLGVKP